MQERWIEADRSAMAARYRRIHPSAQRWLDELVGEAAATFDVPFSAITIVDGTTTWVKAIVGLSVTSAPRCDSLCAHVIHNDEVLVITDTTRNARFVAHPSVCGDLGVRFYAGAPLILEGRRLGALCVFDNQPREWAGVTSVERLRRLASRAVASLELGRMMDAG